MYIGVDVGRGYVKAYAGLLGDVKFPSYVAPARELDLENENGKLTEHMNVEINGKRYFIGELARREGGSREFQKEKAKHRNTIPLLVTAVALMAQKHKIDHVVPNIVVGLPISDYKRQATQFEKTAAGYYDVQLNQYLIRVKIHRRKIIAFPEGAGVIWDKLLNEKGKVNGSGLDKKTLASLDIGWKTCNFSVMRAMQYDDGASGTLPLGLSRAFRIFYKRISRDFDIVPSQAEKELVRNGGPELETLAQEIKDRISMWWPNTHEFDHIYLAGGGGKALSEYLDLPKAEVVSDAQNANARGFYKVARARLGQ